WDAFHWLFPSLQFVGFDSFEGFPEIQQIDKQEIWQKGKSSMDEASFIQCLLDHGIPRERFVTVKGFYDRTLTPDLQRRLLPTKAAVVYVDCDLYHSTVPVLQFIVPFLQRGTVIVFDEWNAFYGDPEKGERRAFREFEQGNSQWQFMPFVSTNMAQSFICMPKVHQGA
ncbi:MAG: TylF/MycF/NovP-related O-methyltransferase, partial [Patescibacteria group bacterium]